jgi:hypothetical protein
MPFTFLLGLGAFAVGILWMVDVDKSRLECRRYLEGEAVKMYKMSDSLHGSMSTHRQSGEEEPRDGEQADKI